LTSVTIEYVIMIPLLFTQVIVFPLVASTMVDNWQNSQRNIELQDTADHLASTIQQLYLTINSQNVLAGTVNQASTLPITVASYPYTATGSLNHPLDPDATKILTVTLTMDDVGNTVTAKAVLGPNVQWIESTFRSTSTDASINVQKLDDAEHTLVFSFGAD
jgi:hypothetical protein